MKKKVDKRKNTNSQLCLSQKSSKNISVQHENRSQKLSELKKSKALPKKNKICPQNCSKHIFEIKKTFGSKFHPKVMNLPVSINFCSTTEATALPSYVPQFCNQPQIPFFLSGSQIIKYNTYLQQSKLQYQEIVKNALKQQEDTEPQQIYHAIPKATQCQVCRIKIQNYDAHVKTPSHLLEVKNSIGQKLIEEEIQDFRANFCKQQKNQQLFRDIKDVTEIYKHSKKALKALLKQFKQSKIYC